MIEFKIIIICVIISGFTWKWCWC